MGAGWNFKRSGKIKKGKKRGHSNIYLSQMCESTIDTPFSLLGLDQKWSNVVWDQLQDRQRKIKDRLQTVLVQRHWRVTTWSDGHNYAWLTTNWQKLWFYYTEKYLKTGTCTGNFQTLIQLPNIMWRVAKYRVVCRWVVFCRCCSPGLKMFKYKQ